MAKKKEITVENKLRALYDLQLIDSRVDMKENMRMSSLHKSSISSPNPPTQVTNTLLFGNPSTEMFAIIRAHSQNFTAHCEPS